MKLLIGKTKKQQKTASLKLSREFSVVLEEKVKIHYQIWNKSSKKSQNCLKTFTKQKEKSLKKPQSCAVTINLSMKVRKNYERI